MKPFLVKLAFIIMITSTVAYSQLPDNWMGIYKGKLEVLNYKGETSEVSMKLQIEPKTDSSYTFTLTYGEDTTKQVRNYELIHDKGNQFFMDEKNGIMLPMMLFNSRLVSIFEVEGNLLQVSYARHKKRLFFRTTSSKESIKTGGKEGVPFVQGYLPYVDQFASLKKQK